MGSSELLLLSCFPGRVTSIARGLAFRLEPRITCFLFGDHALLLLRSFRCMGFALSRDAGVLSKALCLTFSRTCIACSAHGGPRRPSFSYSRIIRSWVLTELCRHRLLRIPGSIQPFTKFLVLHSAY